MDQRISIITLGVSDLDASRAFYSRLGFKEAKASQKAIAFFSMGSFVFALFPQHELRHDVGTDLEGAGPGAMTLAYNARSKEETDEVLAHAVNCGAKLLKPAEEVFWGGYSGYFADPDGHLWEVAYNPHWPIEADGSIHLD